MKVSKEKILDTARKMFNQNGLTSVTARAISAELEISPGSFSYHFPDKSRLVIELYRKMIDELNACFSLLKEGGENIKPFLITFQKCAQIQLKYKFFFLNLSEILINYPVIKQMHKRAIVRERLLAHQLFENYLNCGVIRSDTDMRDVKCIIKQSQILFAYWIVDAHLSEFNSDAQTIWYYTEACCTPIKPYLEMESKNEFEKFLKSKENG